MINSLKKALKVSIANPSVPPHVKQNVRAYYEAKQLACFYTSFFYHSDNRLSSLLYHFRWLRTDLNRRAFNDLPISFFKSRPIPELVRSLAARKLTPTITDKIWEWAELGFDKWVSRRISRDLPDIIHTYEHSALKTLEIARKQNIFTVYEQISQHHTFFKPLIEQQLLQYPILVSNTNQLLINEKSILRDQRRDRELAIADFILCNSTFTKNTLLKAGVKEDKIQVIPLGFPETISAITKQSSDKPFRFLYAGAQSIRKGTHLLFEAWRACAFPKGKAELWLIGGRNDELQLGKDLPDNVIIKNNMPHEQLMSFYKEVDVFVLPTLADGFGMVITEAMSQGVPVITTSNSCGPDIINKGENGWIIEAGSVEAITKCLKEVLENRKQIDSVKAAALSKAKSWQWQDYRNSLAEIVEKEWQKKRQKKSV